VKEYKMDQEDVRLLREGKEAPGADKKQLALIRFGRKVAADPAQITDQDIRGLKEHGLEDSEIVEALSVVMLSALTNTFASALNIEEDVEPAVRREYF
jgi:alkylhydroperoxidase family enzyme